MTEIMRAYINAVLNHFRVLQEWGERTQATMSLDIRTFEVEIRHRNRYYVMQPMFQARINGQLTHQRELRGNVFGFGGWRPYRPLMHPMSTHKLQFRSALRERGMTVPRTHGAPDPAHSVPFDYLVKADVGSFGTSMLGPFRASRPASSDALRPPSNSAVFVEEFIQGRPLKVWFWGGRPVFAQAHDYPTVTGDGQTSLDGLLRRRLRLLGEDWDHHPSRDVILTCLQYQGMGPASVLPADAQAWIDYRFAQYHLPYIGTTPQTDDALSDLLATTGDQIGTMGAMLDELTRDAFPAPILLTADGMLDPTGRIFWLEMNTNSIMPPEGYPVMLDDLFG